MLKISQKPLPGAKTKQSTRLDLFIHSTHLTQSPLVSILIRIFLKKILFTLLTSSENAYFVISDLIGPGQMIWTPMLYSDNSRRAVSK